MKEKKIMHKIFKLSPLDTVYDCLSLDESKFKLFGEVAESPENLIYIDRGADILGVAHLDTVLPFSKFELTSKNILVCETLDDRLGVWVLLYVLPNLGINCDILLTTGEEKCSSSAKWFTSPKSYNWIFQFDRAGDSNVLYQYESKRLIKALKRFGLGVGIGSYSDICELGHLGVCGINFGTGYFNNHSPLAFCDLSMLYSQVFKFRSFYTAYKNTRFKYDPNTFTWSKYYDRRVKPSPVKSYKYEESVFDLSYDTCDLCGDSSNFGEYFKGFGYLCPNCAIDLGLIDDIDYIEYPTPDQINKYLNE